ncbi:MAG TPA: FAD-dependent oxidoreductase, partial [bacterium]|nr:FAD-dependent oxidoreductase [bacterium]
VVKERSATPIFEPGSPKRLSQATALDGLALAGDWTETFLPATIEGAVRSGRMAVEALSFDKR